ncbi:AGAP002995-PA-like protein [Anopheles sinensis]|uniref:AGAP002995-PA-like protein n=1 Tax=Anopheles sinensis TaxID=74873 RepID=A0A084VRK1_ANOSI|nr:AGAP002995-PA-like protein [Anopheles sinensis]
MLCASSSHYENFRKLEDFFNDRSFARNHPLTRRIRERCYRWGNCFTLIPQAGVLFVMLQCIYLKQYEKKSMMLVIRGDTIGTPLTHSLYISFLYFPSLCFFMGCSMVNVCLMGFLAEMEILATQLGELDDTVRRRLADEGNETCRKSFWIAYHDELRRCAKRHCEIFEMIDHMKQFSSLLFLLQHVFSLSFLVASAYVVLRANALRENIIFVEYPIPLVFLYFIFCLLVEKVQDMNNLIGQRLYGTEWMLQLRYSREFHHEYRSAVCTIAILLGRSQQRIRFTCGSINEVSMAKFTEFLNLIYTILMFFININ